MPTMSTENNMTRISCASFVVWGTTLAFMSTLSPADAFMSHLPAPVNANVGWNIDNRNIPSVSNTALSMARRRGRPQGPLRTIEVKPTMNGEITFAELRVVTPNPKGKDEPLGVMSKADALAKAKDMGNLDLILINAQSDPPVCKIVDYSKYRYMKEKKAKELKKNSKASEVKEVKMSYKIDVHDYGVRSKSAAKFLNQGNRVKVTVMFRGREVQHDKLGFELVDKLALDLDKICVKEGKAVREGRNLHIFLTPKPEVVKKINENKRAEEKKKRRAREQSLKERDAASGIPELDGLEDELGGSEVDLNAVALEVEEAKKGLKEDDEDDDDDLASSLDDLLGGDDLTDDLFA